MNLPFFERDDVDIDDLFVEADAGNNQAQFELGYMLLFGLCVRQCPVDGLGWLFRAAVAGHAKAQAQLAEHYLFGEDASINPSNPAEAIKWLYLSARQREPRAMYHLGYCFYHGHGVAPNEEQAFSHLFRAAHLGYSDAQFQLARFYQEGVGCQPNQEQAEAWCREAALQENEQAKEMLKYL